MPRSSSVLAAALALAVAPMSPVHADHRLDVLPLAPVVAPEGISAGPGTTFFVGDRDGGDVYVGDVRREGLRLLVSEQPGAVAVGLLYDAATKRVWVAGGPTGTITAYDARTGEQVFRAQTDGGFLNDVAITRDAVYVTDSRAARLYVVPLGRGASLPADGTFDVLTLRGDYRQPTGENAFGLNGIRVLPGGDLIAVSGGVLYVIDPDTGDADEVEVRGEDLTGGDGLVLRGSTLYVVRGYADRESVVQLRLKPRKGTATVVGELVDEDFDVPTTAALVAGDLYVVNGQFTSPEGEETEVVRVDRRGR